MTPLKFLILPGVVALCVAAVRVSLMFRARAMRALAANWGFRYIGPPAFSWRGFPFFPKVRPPVPVPFSLAWWPANKIRQVWNVIEGQEGGVSVLIFDSFIGGIGKAGKYRTFFACETEHSPFGIDTSPDYIVQSRGWTIRYGVPRFLDIPWATWSMGIRCLEDHLNKLRVGSGVRA
jgi:hypothetical protein